MGKKPKKVRSIARRLTRRIGLAQLIILGLASWLIYNLSRKIVKEEETDLYQSYLKVSNQGVSRVLSDIMVSTTNRVDEIQEHLNNPDGLSDIMRRIVESNPRIRSCGLSFVADYYPKKGKQFCPYAVRDDNGDITTRVRSNASQDYLTSDWFMEALAADSAYWSKPFIDATDSVTPLTAYMIPIHDKRGNTVAILGADLKLNLFCGREISGVNVNGRDVKVYMGDNPSTTGKSNNVDEDDDDNDIWSERHWRFVNYNFIIDSNGTFIAHPDSDHIVRENYFNLAKETNDTIDDYIGHQMVKGEEGTYMNDNEPSYFEFFDMKGSSAYIFYQPVAHTDWSIALVVPRFMIDGLAIGIGIALLIFMGLGLLVGRIVGRLVIKRTMKPLSKLADSANEVAKGNFLTPLPVIKHNDEIRQLRDSFEGMQHSLAEYMEELKSTTASKAAIENELKVAHDIQMSMLPKTFPPYPERNDIDIYGTLAPAKDVGGDLFDFYIRDEKLYFCIGDVSGKGVPASLVMAVTRSLFRNISAHVSKPNLIVSALNDALSEGNVTNMFVTLFIGVLDLQTGVLKYCNAGHNSPLIIGHNVSLLLCDPNLPIGIESSWQFSCQEIKLKPQSSIFLYTDGLNEAENINHAQFGDQRIIDVAKSLTATETPTPTTIVNRMGNAVHRFVGDAEQSDDLTMLSIKYQNQTIVE